MKICLQEHTKGAPRNEQKELRSSGEHRRCGFANGAGELYRLCPCYVLLYQLLVTFYRVFCNFRVKKEVSHNFFHFTILLLFFPVNFRNCSILCFQNYGFDYEIQQHNHTEYDTVPAESCKTVLGDIIDEKLDGENGNDECHH